MAKKRRTKKYRGGVNGSSSVSSLTDSWNGIDENDPGSDSSDYLSNASDDRVVEKMTQFNDHFKGKKWLPVGILGGGLTIFLFYIAIKRKL